MGVAVGKWDQVAIRGWLDSLKFIAYRLDGFCGVVNQHQTFITAEELELASAISFACRF